MIATLALAVVGSWTYAGFLAEPSPSPAPDPEPTPPPASAPIEPASEIEENPAETPLPETPATPPAEATKPPASPPPIPPSTTPTLYRATDASGQAWEHPDPAYLSRFVEARNRSFVLYTYTYSQPVTYRTPQCVNGRCN